MYHAIACALTMNVGINDRTRSGLGHRVLCAESPIALLRRSDQEPRREPARGELRRTVFECKVFRNRALTHYSGDGEVDGSDGGWDGKDGVERLQS